MSSGFGFTRFPQTPSPDPRQVGRALGQRPGAGMAPAPGPGVPEGEQPGAPETGPLLFQRLRRLGAVRMGGAGQTGTGSAPPGEPDYPASPEGDEAKINAAIGEALTRMGGGLMPAPDMSPERASRRRTDLLRHGITPFEIELLQRSGGI